MHRSLLATVACALLLSACGTARPLRPLPQGGWAVEASTPLVWSRHEWYGYPAPDLLVGGRYAVTDGVEVGGRVHLLPLAYGIVGADLFGTWHAAAAAGWRPALHLEADVLGLTRPASYGGGVSESLRGAAALRVLGHWEPSPRLWPYVAAEGVVMLHDGLVFPSAYAGVQWWASPRVALSFELGWVAMTLADLDYSQPFLGPAGRGALWTGLAVSFRWDDPAPAVNRRQAAESAPPAAETAPAPVHPESAETENAP